MKPRCFWVCLGILTLALQWPALAATKGKTPVIAAGQSHTLTIRADGSLYAWGSNQNGQLGQGDNVNLLYPTLVPAAFPWVAAAAGDNHTLAINSGGDLYAWGS